MLYKTKVTAVGGRNGSIQSEDGLLHLKLALPNALGGTSDATNPEQLFAGGYAACFGNAVLHVSRRKGVKIQDQDVTVAGTVGLSTNGSGGFVLSVSLDVTIVGVDQETAQALVDTAHSVCPYSNAVKGNIDVAISVKVQEPQESHS